jgi:RecB family exonuclease
VPAGDEVFSPRDFRTRAVAEAVGGDFARWVTLPYQAATAHAAPNIVAALRASQDRARGPAYGPYEGILLSPAAGRVLAERFGPEHAWSASRLEQYAGCPFQFYVQHVLRLEPVEDPVLATDYLNRGRMLHWLLAALHRSLNERGGARVSPAATASDQLADDVTALIAELVTRLRRDHPLADGLMEIDARRLATWLMRYHAQHLKYDEAWAGWDAPPRPAHFEVSFGRADSDPDAADPTDPLSRGEPFVLDCGGQAVRFTGRIDRIDVGSVGGQTVFNIIDYKSGRSSRGKIASTFEGYAFQLPLYALAAQRLLGSASALPLRAAYWHVSDRGCQDAIEFHIVDEGHLHASDEWQALAANLRRRMGSLVAGVRQGQFPMHSADQECTSRCAYHTVCRVNQARALEKTWQPPAQELS